jgi:hypothetical protein
MITSSEGATLARVSESAPDVSVQRRRRDEPMVDDVRPIGGGLFFVLPGFQDDHDWYGRGMFA